MNCTAVGVVEELVRTNKYVILHEEKKCTAATVRIGMTIEIIDLEEYAGSRGNPLIVKYCFRQPVANRLRGSSDQMGNTR